MHVPVMDVPKARATLRKEETGCPSGRPPPSEGMAGHRLVTALGNGTGMSTHVLKDYLEDFKFMSLMPQNRRASAYVMSPEGP